MAADGAATRRSPAERHPLAQRLSLRMLATGAGQQLWPVGDPGGLGVDRVGCHRLPAPWRADSVRWPSGRRGPWPELAVIFTLCRTQPASPAGSAGVPVAPRAHRTSGSARLFRSLPGPALARRLPAQRADPAGLDRRARPDRGLAAHAPSAARTQRRGSAMIATLLDPRTFDRGYGCRRKGIPLRRLAGRGPAR